MKDLILHNAIYKTTEYVEQVTMSANINIFKKKQNVNILQNTGTLIDVAYKFTIVYLIENTSGQ